MNNCLNTVELLKKIRIMEIIIKLRNRKVVLLKYVLYISYTRSSLQMAVKNSCAKIRIRTNLFFELFCKPDKYPTYSYISLAIK